MLRRSFGRHPAGSDETENYVYATALS